MEPQSCEKLNLFVCLSLPVQWVSMLQFQCESFAVGLDTDSLDEDTDIEEETIEFFIKEETEVIEEGE